MRELLVLFKSLFSASRIPTPSPFVAFATLRLPQGLGVGILLRTNPNVLVC